MAIWLRGYVAMWLSGYLAKWLCGQVLPLPLNIPTHTPAPDRGGPVACLGAPVGVVPILETNKAQSEFLEKHGKYGLIR